MHLLALTIKLHTTIRLQEIAGALIAIAGVAMLAPMGMLGGRRIAGLALVAAGVLWVVARHWGPAF
jgi:drug/metabolite transporter (DMT)-like permease